MLLSLQPFWVPLEGGCSKAAMDGPDGTGKGDEIGGEAATPVDSSGTRARDKGPKTRDQGPRQSHRVGEPLRPGFQDGTHPVAFRGRRSG